jgi:hypothetical protein
MPGEGAVKSFSSKRRWAAAGILVLLLLYVLRPGASPLKSRIIASISSGVGRPVDIGYVRIRVLPRPGFDLQNLVVYDDAAFGSEPMLRASEVAASLRLTSLFRGRMEIGRLDLAEPSLNLVRGEDGHWNVETLLERSARIPLAPTAKAKSEPRPGFPYIDATSGRINFMVGREKKAYALANADFSLWQESENAWGMRLKAQPIRTDLNLNDTGVLQASGTWQRASTLRDTPVEFTLAWDRPQLGQLTKLLSGRDQGWRGGLQIELSLAGTPAKLRVSSDASVQDFQRYDIISGEALRLAAHCDAEYSSVDRTFHQLLCSAPVGNGLITLKGDAGIPAIHTYDLSLSASEVPAAGLLALAARAKKNLPEDLIARGNLNGRVAFNRNGQNSDLRLDGRGEIDNLHLTSAELKSDMGPVTVPLTLTSKSESKHFGTAHGSGMAYGVAGGVPHLEFGPFALTGGRLMARGWVSRSGYRVLLEGEGEIGKTLRVARVFGIPTLQAAAEGSAQVDLQLGGDWSGLAAGAQQGFVGPEVLGTVKLRGARFTLHGTAAPIDVATADVKLLPESVQVEDLNATAANASWRGSLEMPRGCGSPGACEIHFNLNTSQIALTGMSEWASPTPKARPWYRVLESDGSGQPSFLGSVRASGRVGVERLQIHNLAAAHVSANLALDRGKMSLSNITADFLGGKYRGEWKTNFREKPVTSTSSGRLQGVALADLAQAMRDGWISGIASGSYELTGTGRSAEEFWHSAEGSLRFDVKQGSLAHISLEQEGPLRILRLSGVARLHDGKIDVKDAGLDSTDGKFEVSGTASFERQLDLKLTGAGSLPRGYNVTGSLADPQVKSVSVAEQARLKKQ